MTPRNNICKILIGFSVLTLIILVIWWKISLPVLSASIAQISHLRIDPKETLKVKLDKRSILSDELVNLIHQRYEFDNFKLFQFFLISWNIQGHGWDILKYKLAIKLLSDDLDSRFVMVFSGTSVTAGYDNNYNDSYPSLLERKLSPVLSAMGIKLVVRNIAQYQVNCKLRWDNLCVSASLLQLYFCSYST